MIQQLTKMDPVDKRLIVVLGMHRSGTSAITRSLELLGVGLGNNLHPASFDNPKGFWEDRECLEINENLLNFLGSAYDRLDLAWENIKDVPLVSSLKSNAVEIIQSKLEENCGLWGFKDPRTCRLLSFWREVFKEAGCEVSFVIVLRNPASVTSSLVKRNKIPEEKAYFLWLQHMLPAVIETKGSKRVVVDFDEFMDAPYTQLKRISTVLELSLLDRKNPLVQEFENNFLERELRHSKFSETELALDESASPDVVTAYKLLLQAAKDEQRLDDSIIDAEFGELNVKMKAYSPIFSYTNTLEDEKLALNQTVAERDGQIVALNQTVAERDEQIVALNQTVAERDEQIVALNQNIQIISGELEQLLTSKSWYITKPLRFFRRNMMSRPYFVVRSKLSDSLRWCWYQLPISQQFKQKVKGSLFRVFPFVFTKTQAYRSWKSFNGTSTSNHHSERSLILDDDISSAIEYVSKFKGKSLQNKSVKLISFYLPQFHSIPENDEWWGEGFTEWTNVKPAQPQFVGHYQPHVAGDLGYYNLLDSDIQHHQVELAKLYGIEGFCFYFYWFDGKRLLEKPAENYLKDERLDFPFCLCWANENWSRRWDGLDSEILIGQEHSAEDDIAFIEYVSRYLKDERYIKIDGKPLLLVYRPSLLPSAKETVKRWREWCRNNDVGEIYLAYTQSFESVDPRKYGFDAAIEFPPNNMAPPLITSEVMDRSPAFTGQIYDWRAFLERSNAYKKTSYTLFRGVNPGWDNTARRKSNGTILYGSSPLGYKRWLSNAVEDTVTRFSNKDERLIFINAWNEWAEGAHLEPDARYGYAYLQATRDALNPNEATHKNSILLVTHDCHPHGAQFLILETARQLRTIGFEVAILVLGGGSLLEDFSRVGKTLEATQANKQDVWEFLSDIRTKGTKDVITSTVVSGQILPQLKNLGFRVLSLIHEMPGVIRDMKQEENAELIATMADKVVFPAKLVNQGFSEIVPVNIDKVVIRPQGLLRKNPYKNKRNEAHQEVCKKHQFPEDTQFVLSIAYVDSRKGADLFVEIAAEVLKTRPKTVFIWVGHAEAEMKQKVESRIKQLGIQDSILFTGFDREPMIYYAAASVYALTSREDPFPNVVLESAEVGVPVIAFQGASGAGDFILEQGGRLANHLNTGDFAQQVCELLSVSIEKTQTNVGSLQQYVLDLLHHLNSFARVSVVVPNYNYAKYLVDRINSITQQDYPIFEIIILDDASKDESVRVISELTSTLDIDCKFIACEYNSGNPFVQWLKGVEIASGDYVWIAEADDLTEQGFLSEVMRSFDDPGVVMSYCQSKQIDSSGKIFCDNYLDYTSEISSAKWLDYYTNEGVDEVKTTLAIKNTIPNVSAVVFKREVLFNVLQKNINEIKTYRIAGDWLTYLLVLEAGKISFSPDALNLHRRHKESITLGNFDSSQLKEILSVQKTARDIFHLDKDVIERAQAYSEHLYENLGLITEHEPELSKSPKLNVYLENSK